MTRVLHRAGAGWRAARIALCGCVLLVLWACAVFQGQRITLFHDVPGDELLLVIHYDGIHEQRGNGNGKLQIEQFVREGEILFLDWPLHLPTGEARKMIAAGGDLTSLPRTRALVRYLLEHGSVTFLGSYRDFDGRVGAAQLVRVPGAREFVRLANQALDEALIETQEVEAGWSQTRARMLGEASTGAQWITLDGHAVRLSAPVHPDEWAYLKARGLSEVLSEMFSRGAKKGSSEGHALAVEARIRKVVQALTAVPLSYQEHDGRVTVQIGLPQRPSTLRFHLRDSYESSLEETVHAHGGGDLDGRILGAQRAGVGEEGEGLEFSAELLKLLPPEERVRALIREAERDDAEVRRRAFSDLGAFATRWNENSLPRAPVMAIDLDDDARAVALEAWKRWYRQMIVFPLDAVDG